MDKNLLINFSPIFLFTIVSFTMLGLSCSKENVVVSYDEATNYYKIFYPDDEDEEEMDLEEITFFKLRYFDAQSNNILLYTAKEVLQLPFFF